MPTDTSADGSDRRAWVQPAVVEQYLAHARAGDHRSATADALGLLDDGVPPAAVVDELLVSAQRETGRRWLSGEWSVTDEHRVTSTTAAVVEAVAGVAAAPTGSGALTVVVADGDWHGLPARLFAEGMRQRGWAVTFLGGGVPVDEVAAHLERRPPDAVAVTCTVALALPGAARIVDVAHAVGVPVLVGGAAVQGRPHRAAALGADATAESLDEADTVLRELRGRSPARPTDTPSHRALVLDAAAPEYADAAIDRLGNGDGDELQRRQLREALESSARHVAAAQLVDDPTVWKEFVAWQSAFFRTRRQSAEPSFPAGIRELADLVQPADPTAADLLRQVEQGS